MGIDSRRDEIIEIASRLIKRKARKMNKYPCFNKLDTGDIAQELWLDFLRRIEKFNKERAKLITFISMVVKNKEADMVAAQMAKKRNYSLCTSSINAEVDDGEGNTVQKIEKVDEEDYLQKIGNLGRSIEERINLRIDIERVVDILPPEFRSLFKDLKTKSVTKISLEKNIPISTVRERKEKIRAILKGTGIEDYL